MNVLVLFVNIHSVVLFRPCPSEFVYDRHCPPRRSVHASISKAFVRAWRANELRAIDEDFQIHLREVFPTRCKQWSFTGQCLQDGRALGLVCPYRRRSELAGQGRLKRSTNRKLAGGVYDLANLQRLFAA